jgi:hypothetical protein
MRVTMLPLLLALLVSGCSTHRNLTVKQVRSIADSAAVAAGYSHDAWVQQFVVYNSTRRVWSVSYCNNPPHRSYAGFSVAVHDETRDTTIQKQSP